MAETTASPEPGLEGESELSRQGIWQGHSDSCKGKYRRGVPTVDQMCISVPGVGLLKQLSGARLESGVSKEFARRFAGPDDTKPYTGELDLTASEAGKV